jgi:hypothetical protein
MPNQTEFNEYLKSFDELENRGSYYPMFIKMIKMGLDTEAFLFILSTWNFAVFRYAMKDFNLNEFRLTIKSLKPEFDKLKEKKLESIELHKYRKEIEYIFRTLSKIKGIQFTGASKLMHLMAPKVFVMWDAWIRKAWGFKIGNEKNYFNFLEKMKIEFKGLKGKENRTLAKCIDEYNYVKFTLPALKKQKDRRLGNKK